MSVASEVLSGGFGVPAVPVPVALASASPLPIITPYGAKVGFDEFPASLLSTLFLHEFSTGPLLDTRGSEGVLTLVVDKHDVTVVGVLERIRCHGVHLCEAG
ncbi:hypothetical protein GCM10010521_75390 [Streptomyces rameus]|uniref:Uncharacterized protein n=1 Tax=Streptomyces rameus TaxID=68261 RepID=A0ABN3VAB5_9ACTN